jgi:hypothetical protein
MNSVVVRFLLVVVVMVAALIGLDLLMSVLENRRRARDRSIFGQEKSPPHASAITLNSTSHPHPLHVLNLIGYWVTSWPGSDAGPGWPDPRDVIGPWDPTDRQGIISYLQAGVAFRYYRGSSSCRICQVMLGSGELTDGTWAWPEKLEHYVDAHDVQLPLEFVEFARAAAWRIPKTVEREFASPEVWPLMDSRPSSVFLKPDAWLDWAAAAAPARPASDAMPIEEAQALCVRLSHRNWYASLEERWGRWRIICRSGADERLIYVERSGAEHLQRRLLAWRNPDPDALLDPERANAIAGEFDGSWGAMRVLAGTDEWWLLWVVPAGDPWPTEGEVRKAAEVARVGWTMFNPGGSRSFVSPRLDELQWRRLVDDARAQTRPRPATPRPAAAPPPAAPQPPASGPQSVPLAWLLYPAIGEAVPYLKARLRDLWECLRAVVRR